MQRINVETHNMMMQKDLDTLSGAVQFFSQMIQGSPVGSTITNLSSSMVAGDNRKRLFEPMRRQRRA